MFLTNCSDQYVLLEAENIVLSTTLLWTLVKASHNFEHCVRKITWLYVNEDVDYFSHVFSTSGISSSCPFICSESVYNQKIICVISAPEH